MNNTWDNVNWEEQWKLHAPTFQNGKAVIDLATFGGFGEFSLLPGPGFGDLSHPTTNLMLSSMVKLQSEIKDAYVIDIGSGSGILSFAAKLLGAKEVFGVEIDETAILHAQKNAGQNSLEITFTKHLWDNPAIKDLLPLESLAISSKKPPQAVSHHSTSTPAKKVIVLMNMISSEQEEIWKNLPILPSVTYVLSGVLQEQRTDYIKKFRNRELIQELLLNDWVSFTF